MPSNRVYTGYVYLIGSSRYGWFKIGKSRCPDVRITDLGVLLPFRVDLYALWGTSNHSLLESSFHRAYQEHRINGEWFGFSKEVLMKIIADYPPHFGTRLFPERVIGDIKPIVSSVVDDRKFCKRGDNMRSAHYQALCSALDMLAERFPDREKRGLRKALQSSVNGLWGEPLDKFIKALDACMQQQGSVAPGPPGL